MTTKFSQHQNILQPKRSLNSAQVGRVQKGGQQRLSTHHHTGNSGSTLTLNGVTIGLPSNAHHMATNSHITTTTTKKGPSTMAKRNARERNRVKQVNQGFLTLRQHIPENYRLKKMSKVDTLRCALNYIRTMERILEISCDSNEESTTVSGYHGYTSEDMNQHLDKICSETSISLDQSFSSFSDNEESCQDCHDSPNFHHHPSQSLHHISDQEAQHCDPRSRSETLSIASSSQENNGPFQNTLTSQPGSIILPLRLTPHSLQENIPSDENFHPSPPFVQVVEIIQL